MRRLPLSDRKAELRKLLGKTNGGLQFVAHAEIEGEEAFATACEAGLEGIVSKRLTAPYKSGPVQVVDQGAQSEVVGLFADLDGSF
jgi:bifunctional non-homologous end joining protein LigD